jgi:hypothetical protein
VSVFDVRFRWRFHVTQAKTHINDGRQAGGAPDRTYMQVRGRLHFRFQCSVWMCSEPSAVVTRVFDVQQNSRSITLNAANIAARRAARRRAAQMRHHAARSAACVLEYSGQKQVGNIK